MNKVKLFLLSIMLLIGTAAHADTTPNWSLDIPTSTDKTNWSDRFSQAFIDIDAIIPPGTVEGQTMVWDADNSKWVTNSLLNIDFDNGRVGIGVDVPEQQLHISGTNSRILHETGGSGGGYFVEVYGTPRGGLETPSGAFAMRAATGNKLSFYTSGAENLTIGTSGHVGINTITPDTKLHVVDTGGAQQTWSYTEGSIESTWETNSAGVTTLDTSGDKWKINGSIHTPEITTPTAIADYGAVYPKADNKLYFQDGAGTEKTILTSESTITASVVSDFDIEVANNSAVSLNTAKVTYPGESAISLANLGEKSASSLNAGNLAIARMPTGGTWPLSTALTLNKNVNLQSIVFNINEINSNIEGGGVIAIGYSNTTALYLDAPSISIRNTSAPASSAASGSEGMVAIGTGYFYFHDGVQWLRLAGATF